MRRRQGRGASRTSGGLPRTVSPSPHHERMGVYRRPHQPSHLSYNPSVAFPTRRTGRLCDREIPHGVAGQRGKGRWGTVPVSPRESPLLCRPCRPRTLSSVATAIHAFYHFPLARSVPRVLVTHAPSFSRNQPRRRRSLLEPHTAPAMRTAESSPRDGVLRCVRPRIDRLASVGRVRAIASLMRANATEI